MMRCCSKIYEVGYVLSNESGFCDWKVQILWFGTGQGPLCLPLTWWRRERGNGLWKEVKHTKCLLLCISSLLWKLIWLQKHTPAGPDRPWSLWEWQDHCLVKLKTFPYHCTGDPAASKRTSERHTQTMWQPHRGTWEKAYMPACLCLRGTFIFQLLFLMYVFLTTKCVFCRWSKVSDKYKKKYSEIKFLGLFFYLKFRWIILFWAGINPVQTWCKWVWYTVNFISQPPTNFQNLTL